MSFDFWIAKARVRGAYWRAFWRSTFVAAHEWLRQPHNHLRWVLLAPVIALALIWSNHSPPNRLQYILDRDVLRIGVRLDTLVYYNRDDLTGGLDFHILSRFADHLGLELEVQVIDSIAELLQSVDEGTVHIGAAHLSVTPNRRDWLAFSRPYMEVTSVAVQHSSKRALSGPEQLVGREIVAISDSSHAEALALLAQQHPQIEWTEESELLMFELMQRVQNQEVDMAVVGSTLLRLEQPFFPRVVPALALDEPSPVAFALRRDEDTSLLEALDSFLEEFEASGELSELIEDVYRYNESFNVAGSLVIRDRINKRLPEFELLFREVASATGFDWAMLAAIAYQESHWDPLARSYTGVRGLMMLTLPTAEEYGVDNRLDPEQSLRAGAQYLIDLRRRLPDRIEEPDRTKLALAAYNLGMGHLEDGRVLTQRMGGDPDKWDDVRRYLPLLQQETHYRTLRNGYARGREAVAYVDNIYHFHTILTSYAWQLQLESMGVRMGFEDEADEPAPEPEQRTRPYLNIINRAIAPL